jgi:hypothetical protein
MVAVFRYGMSSLPGKMCPAYDCVSSRCLDFLCVKVLVVLANEVIRSKDLLMLKGSNCEVQH